MGPPLVPRKVSLHVPYARTSLPTANYPIDSTDKIAGMPGPEFVFCIRFFNGLPTVKCSVLQRHPNPILCVERGDGSRVVPVECLVELYSQRTNLLGYFWIDRCLFVGCSLALQS